MGRRVFRKLDAPRLVVWDDLNRACLGGRGRAENRFGRC